MKIVLTNDDGTIVKEISGVGSQDLIIDVARDCLIAELQASLKEETKHEFSCIKKISDLTIHAVQRIHGIATSAKLLKKMADDMLLAMNGNQNFPNMFDPLVPRVGEAQQIILRLSEAVTALSKINIREKEIAKQPSLMQVEVALD